MFMLDGARVGGLAGLQVRELLERHDLTPPISLLLRKKRNYANSPPDFCNADQEGPFSLDVSQTAFLEKAILKPQVFPSPKRSARPPSKIIALPSPDPHRKARVPRRILTGDGFAVVQKRKRGNPIFFFSQEVDGQIR